MESFKDIFKKSFLEGFTSMDIDRGRIMATLCVTCILAFYIFWIYRFMTRKVFYSKSFNIALPALAVITSAIILAMQSNLVISLGMVGALSIVRFRTAIKDPMDLVFLFWAISVGIVCGAGLFEIAVITSVIVTIGLLGLELIPVAKAPMMLVVNSRDLDSETQILASVRKYSRAIKVKSRNYSGNQLDMIIEVRVKQESSLVKEVAKIPGMDSVSLISHDGEVTF